jgi:hypothetical protein
MQRTSVVVSVVGIIVAISLGALGWIYTRPVMGADEIAAIRARGQALLAPRLGAAGSVAPAFDCTPYTRLRRSGAHPSRWGQEPSEAEIAALARATTPCREGFDATWDHERLAADASVDEVIDAGGWFVSDATDADAPESVMETTLRGIWAVDGIVRSGRLDVSATGMLGLRAMSLTNLHMVRPLTTDEAARVRERLERVRAAHPRRLDRPELLLLSEADLAGPGGSVSGEQALAWVCTAERVELAERLAALRCGSLATHDCFSRVMVEADAAEIRASEPPPRWAQLLPPRVRRRHDARCAPLAEQLRERARQAVTAEMAFALLDEAIMDSLDGSTSDRAMLRPVPSFEGEPMIRVLEAPHDEPVSPGRPDWGTSRVGGTVRFRAPTWVGASPTDDVLVLFSRIEPTAP